VKASLATPSNLLVHHLKKFWTTKASWCVTGVRVTAAGRTCDWCHQRCRERRAPRERLPERPRGDALKTAAARLRMISRIFAPKTKRFLYTSHHQFAEGAMTANFPPLLAERVARQRPAGLARVNGKASDGKPIVLFLYVHNAGCS
jgi:hypothetical protein